MLADGAAGGSRGRHLDRRHPRFVAVWRAAADPTTCGCRRSSGGGNATAPAGGDRGSGRVRGGLVGGLLGWLGRLGRLGFLVLLGRVVHERLR